MNLNDYVAAALSNEDVLSGKIVPPYNDAPVSMRALQDEKDAVFRQATRLYEGMRMGEMVQDGLVHLAKRDVGDSISPMLAAQLMQLQNRIGAAATNVVVAYIEGMPRCQVHRY